MPTPTVWDPAISWPLMYFTDSYKRCFGRDGYTPRLAQGDIWRNSGKLYVEFKMWSASTWGDRHDAVAGVGHLSTSTLKVPGKFLNTWGAFVNADYGTDGAFGYLHETAEGVLIEGTGPKPFDGFDIIQMAIDIGAGKIWWGCNNDWVGDPGAGTGESVNDVDIIDAVMYLQGSGGPSNRGVTVYTLPADQTYSPPSGFLANWWVPIEADITGALQTDEDSEVVKELHLGIEAGLGSGLVYDPWFNALGVGADTLEIDPLIQPTEFDGVLTPLRDRSPITADASFTGGAEAVYFWQAWYAAFQRVDMDAQVHVEFTLYGDPIISAAEFGFDLSCFNYGEMLRNGEGKITRKYEFTLTGAADSTTDVIIPISSFQARRRQDTPDYLAVVLPNEDYADEIIARTNGTLVIEAVALVDDVETLREVIATANFETIRTTRGARSRSVTLTGYKSNSHTNKLVVLHNASEYSLDNGKITVTTDVDFYLNPGDTVSVEETTFTAGQVNYSISEQSQIMEVVEA